MNRIERANIAAEFGFSHPQRHDGQPAYADLGTALSVGGSLLGGIMQSDSADSAQQAQSESSAAAIAEQRRQFDQSRVDLAPWRNVGGAATNRLGYLLGLSGSEGGGGRSSSEYVMDDFLDYNRRAAPSWYQAPGPQATDAQIQFDRYKSGTGWTPDEFKSLGFRDLGAESGGGGGFGSLNKKFTLADFWDDPVTKASFQFGLDEGTKALSRMAGAKGNRNSGAAVKALTRFGTDYTGQKAGESYNRFYGDQDRIYNRLAGVAGTGQTAATNTAQMGQNTANNVSSLISAQGNARGAAAIAGGNAMSGGIQNAANTFGNWLNGRNSPYQTPPFNPYSMSNTHW